MHVMSKYIDTYRATVAALEDYVAMQHILQTTDQAIKDKAEKLYWFNIPAPEGMPPVRNPKASEDSIAAGTDRAGGCLPAALRPGTGVQGLVPVLMGHIGRG